MSSPKGNHSGPDAQSVDNTRFARSAKPAIMVAAETLCLPTSTEEESESPRHHPKSNRKKRNCSVAAHVHRKIVN